MESVGIRELRQNASAVLAHVQDTSTTIAITNHGHPVAHLVPISAVSQTMRQQLIERGVLRPGRGSVLDVDAVAAPPSTPSSGELLAADRDDR